MKNFVIVIETLGIIGLLIVCIYFYNRLPGEVVQSGENLVEKEKYKTYTFDKNKMKLASEDSIYQDVRYDSIEGITIILDENGKASVTVMPDNEVYKSLYSEIEIDIRNEKLTGFDGKIATVYFAYFGNEIEPCKILFLMEDGSVEYINSEKMIKNKDQKYVSEGKIEGLANIVRFENVAVAYEDENGKPEGGTLTTVAVDKDGYSYDLEKLMNEEE